MYCFWHPTLRTLRFKSRAQIGQWIPTWTWPNEIGRMPKRYRFWHPLNHKLSHLARFICPGIWNDALKCIRSGSTFWTSSLCSKSKIKKWPWPKLGSTWTVQGGFCLILTKKFNKLKVQVALYLLQGDCSSWPSMIFQALVMQTR